MRTVLVGYGKFGRIYTKRLLENKDYELVGIVEPNPYHADKAKADLGEQVWVLPSLGTALEELEFDAVIIATPAETHKEVAAEALINRKDVMCAKPGTMSMAELAYLESIINANDDEEKLFVDYTLLSMPEINNLDLMFSQLGEPESLVTIRRVTGKEPPCGVVHDLFSHDIMLFLYTMGGWGVALDGLSVKAGTTDSNEYTVRIIKGDTTIVAMVAEYECDNAERVAEFNIEPHSFLKDEIRLLMWDQEERSIVVGGGPEFFINFNKDIDPVSWSLDRFLKHTHNGAYMTMLFQGQAIMRAINDSFATGELEGVTF